MPNHTTREIAAFSRSILEEPEYLDSLRRRLKRGSAPHMETLLHHYGYGKPKDVIEMSHPKPLVLELLSDKDTHERGGDSG